MLNKIPLSVRIIVSMILGLLVGAYTSTVFIGVDALANAFVMLLQMTALPYISLSLIVGIGGLSLIEARNTFKQSLFILLMLIDRVVILLTGKSKLGG